MELQIIWFILWGVLWAVYFMLDGFVLGMRMLSGVLGKERHGQEDAASTPSARSGTETRSGS